MNMFIIISIGIGEGDGSVVPEVEGLDKRCNVRFTGEIFDTNASERVSLNKLIDLKNRKPGLEQVPCAFLGAAVSDYLLSIAASSNLKTNLMYVFIAYRYFCTNGAYKWN